jgi:hypothetical protein
MANRRRRVIAGGTHTSTFRARQHPNRRSRSVQGSSQTDGAAIRSWWNGSTASAQTGWHRRDASATFPRAPRSRCRSDWQPGGVRKICGSQLLEPGQAGRLTGHHHDPLGSGASWASRSPRPTTSQIASSFCYRRRSLKIPTTVQLWFGWAATPTLPSCSRWNSQLSSTICAVFFT